jgi:hypothetical protein
MKVFKVTLNVDKSFNLHQAQPLRKRKERHFFSFVKQAMKPRTASEQA